MEVEYSADSSRFVSTSGDISDADASIIGCPFDGTITYHPGSRWGPQHIRMASWSFEDYNVELDRSLDELQICDKGDLILPFGNVKKAIDIITKATDEVEAPVLLGGEHTITLGAVRSMKKRYDDLAVIQFDAHTDLREEYLGERISHSTVMRRIYETGCDVYQFGIRSGTKENFLFAEKNTHLYRNIKDTKKIKKEIAKKPLYITVDIDVLDPAYAPGTGNPEPYGFSTSELFDALKCFRGLNVKGFDVVEVCPSLDRSYVTSVTAAKIVRDCILMFFA